MESLKKDPQVIGLTPGDRTLGQLVADVSRETSGLVQAEIALAKAELKQSAVNGGMGAGMFAGAAVFGFVGFILLCFTGAYGLVAAGLSAWIAFGIVTLVLFVIAAVLALIGLNKVKKVKGPEQTIETSKRSIETIKTAAKIG